MQPERCRSDWEAAARARGYRRIAGLDEAGRGCLFGPVYAAAVVLSPQRPIRGLRDSKQLSPERRQELAARIKAQAEAWAVAWVDADLIDRINILEASRLAMQWAAGKLDPPADYLLVDALTLELPVPQQALIRGDARCRSIAAASILAKVERDRAMLEWDRLFPEYRLARNKGYGSPEHLAALRRHGPSPQHRTSFAPVRLLGYQKTLFDEARIGECH
jgi:ribonuclease HII